MRNLHSSACVAHLMLCDQEVEQGGLMGGPPGLQTLCLGAQAQHHMLAGCHL